jgi:hypothetical protein
VWRIDFCDRSPKIFRRATRWRAYLENPNDPNLALHIAHLHFWKVAERFRLGQEISPNISDELTLAKKYFQEAQKLQPDDNRIKGWLAGAALAEASIHNDEKDKRAAYYQGLDAIKAYPEFNYFSIGFLFSNLEYSDVKFKDAINWYFKSMDLAYHTSVDRDNPDIKNFLSIGASEKNIKLKRAVWNSSIVPHNVEGFYLNFGDFLVKYGKTDLAKNIYNNIKLVPSYKEWPFKYLLEDRLKNISNNVEKFRKNSTNEVQKMALTGNIATIESSSMIFNSYSCMICHQKTAFK